MLLSEYLSGIINTIDEYSKTDLIVQYKTNIDIRTSKIGTIKGSITFITYSKLFFIEYLDLRYGNDKLSYSFHYQDKENELIFRYDNAVHKPRLAFEGHKHLPDGTIVKAIAPDFFAVLEEIINTFL